MSFSEYATYDALGLAELVKRREVSAEELVETCIERIERVNPELNAVVTRMYDDARSQARAGTEGPFGGVPFLIKDSLAPVKGVPYTRGSRLFAEHVPGFDGELTRRYRAAGLILVGKTNLPELGLRPMTESELFGDTENPWRKGITAGGSSGGAGAAVAARVVPMAHGNDGGGSIRIPASCCGLFGMKPTRARTPLGPDESESWCGFAVNHALTRSVRDSAALLDATSALAPDAIYCAPLPARPFREEVGAAPGKLRIALCREPLLPSDPAPEVLRAVEEAAELCASLGHVVEPARPLVDRDQFAMDYARILAVATAADLDDGGKLVGKKCRRSDVELDTWLLAELGRTVDAVGFEHARRRCHKLARDMARFHEEFDVLLTPTLGGPPLPHRSLAPRPLEARAREIIATPGLGGLSRGLMRLPGVLEATAARIYRWMPYTPLANVTGQPSMSVPLAFADGLPIGVLFTGRFGDEATLFRLAAQLEEARPWRDRVPPLSA